MHPQRQLPKRQKQATEFFTALHYMKPDIISGAESWLEGVKPGKPGGSDAIFFSEIFPGDNTVFRNDRNISGGGVFILAHKSLTAEEQPHLVTDCEMTWVKIMLRNLPDLYAGVFYMPHRNKKDLNELMKSLDLPASGAKDRNILLVGNFNCPDVDWNTNTVPESSQECDIQQGLADNMSEAHLSQIHNQPTRLSAILDLVFTTNPTLLKNSTSIPGISDHSIVVADVDTAPHITKEATRKKFVFHKANWDGISFDIRTATNKIETMYHENDSAENLWATCKNSLQASIKKNIPSSLAKKCTRLPWIDCPLLKLKQCLSLQISRLESALSHKHHLSPVIWILWRIQIQKLVI